MRALVGAVGGLLLCGWLSAAVRSEDWPVYQHDVRRSAVSGEQLEVGRLEPGWVYRAATRPVPAWGAPAKWDAYAGIRGLKSMRNYDPVFHPVVAGNRLWFGSSADDTVRCLDTRSGAVLWTCSVDAPVRLAPAVVEGRLYFGSDDGHAYCLEAETGRLLWKFRPAPPAPLVLHDGRFISLWPCRTGVLVADGTAYCAMGMLPWKESYLCAVDALTGRVEGPGRFVRRVEGVTFEGALLASAQRLISPQGRVPPLLFHRADGAPLGALEGGGGSFVLLTDDAHVLHGPGNKTGWVQESQEAGRAKVATFDGATMMIVRGDRSYAQTESDLIAIDRATRRTAWKQPSAYPHTLILAGDCLFAGGTDAVGAFRATDGERVWDAAVEGRAFGLVAANGALYASTDEGRIHCFRPGPTPGPAPAAASSTSTPPPTPAAADPTVPIEPFTDPALAGRWVFRPDQMRGGAVRNLAGGTDAALLGKAEFVPAGAQSAWRLDGATRSALVTGDLTSAELPREAMSAEAWVRVDQPLPWGGLVGAVQDNGDFERGWLLGFVDTRFAFALAGRDGNQRLTYLTATNSFDKGRWYHVLGTYDGQTMRLYINGALEGQSTAQRGPIHYPPGGFYEIGAYHDKDEYFRTFGLLREVRVYRRALTPEEARDHGTVSQEAAPDRLVLKAGPMLAFTGRGEASVWWETTEPTATRLDWSGAGSPARTVEDPTPKTLHRVLLTGLRYDRTYEYLIKSTVGGVTRETEPFECDTYFDFSLAPASPRDAAGPDASDSLARPLVDELIQVSGVRRGLVLLLGAGNRALPQAIARSGAFRIEMIDASPDAIGRSREAALAAGIYGTRVAALQLAAWTSFPFTEAWADLIVVSPECGVDPAEVDPAAVLRMSRPFGGVVLVGRADTAAAQAADGRALWDRWRAASELVAGLRCETRGRWLRFERGSVPGAGQWTHQYGTADNTSFGGERLQGASSIQDLEVQWLGQPGPRAQADRNGRKPAPLASEGRLFVQGLHRIVALDAYNGSVLWSRELPLFERFNLPRDCSNWCADRNRLYAVVKAECWELAAETGDLRQRHPVVRGPRADWAYDWGFVSAQDDQLIGTAVKEGAAYTEFWGGSDAGWYDATAGPATYTVGSDTLFALDLATGKPRWQYAKGIILNPTIAIAGNELCFVETRHPAVLGADTRRLGQAELWEDLWLVTLDARSGTRRWERPFRPAPGVVMVSMAAAADRLVVVTSGNGRYHVYALDRADGRLHWEQTFPWPKDNHGGHMARPTIVGNTLFVRPRVFDLASGRMSPSAVPSGGCGTCAATERTLIFRDGNVTLWDFGRGTTTSWSRLRPDCWLSTVPALGLLLSPEAGGGCSCGSWLETSIAFRPAPTRPGDTGKSP